MRLLCDTQIILWLMLGDRRLKPAIEAILADRANDVLFSSVSLWEIAIKIRVGKFDVDVQAVDTNCRRAGMTLLPLALPHIVTVSKLTDTPHEDPFDHLLVAQAKTEAVPLLTSDHKVQRYPIEIIKA